MAWSCGSGRSFLLASFAACALVAWGCADGGTGPGGGRDTGVDGGSRDGGGGDASVRPDARMTECMVDGDCTDDGIFCNGELGCEMGRCVARNIPSCDDGIVCTTDACSGAMDMCTNTPNDMMCPMGTRCYSGRGCADAPPCEFDSDCGDDGVFCNGVESCVMGTCRSAGMRDCDDMNNCTMDECSEGTGPGMGMCLGTPFPDILTSVMNCGTGMNDCVVCPVPAPALHQVATCVMGACGLECEMGYVDADADPANGCELMCTPMAGVDLPDDSFRDSNCDGIDGDRALAVFVSNSGTDMNDGLTSTTPVATVTRALAVAGMASRSQVLFVTATYNVSAAVSLQGGISFYGGYSADFLTRTDTRASIVSSAATAARAEGLGAAVTLDRVNLTTADRSGTSSDSTTTLYVRDSGDFLTLRFVNVLAGRGGNGSDGGPGSGGSNGVRGTNGSGASGGGGGSVGGGAGASGRNRASGPAGAAGSGGSCGSGGAAGSGSGGGGLGCGDGDPQAGGNGGDGCTAGPGTAGAAGLGLGTLAPDGTWTPTSGGDGSTGGRGGGGGGGGAGGGEDCTVFGGCVYCDTGRGGGGGGGGGAGGTGGSGATGGGASIGIVILNSTLNAHQVRVQTAGGGRGGAGGSGGTAGTGGGGGTGETPGNSSQGRGGNGGNGGNGGAGGCGGGGGGGPSIGIWGTGTSSLYRELTPVVFVIGSGGGGGTSCGNAGNPGTEGNTRQAFPG